MLKSSAWTLFTWVYFVLVLADIIALNIYVEAFDLHIIFKPLIMISALYFLINYLKHKHCYKWVLAAFLFSWLGDVLLLGQGIDNSFFVGGLSAFLLAHIAYIVYFRKSAYKKAIGHRGIAVLQIAVVFAAGCLYLLMYPNLGALWLPVLLYVITIAMMGIAACARYARVALDTFSYTAIGAFIFILSDSLIGYHKFVFEIPFVDTFIMLFYSVAQYLILKGFVVYQKGA